MCVYMCSVKSDFCDPMNCSPPGFSGPWDFPGKNTGLSFPPPRNLPSPGIKFTSLASSALTGGFFTTAPPGKSSTGVGCQLSNTVTMTNMWGEITVETTERRKGLSSIVITGLCAFILRKENDSIYVNVYVLYMKKKHR